jgi:hypothetical protein
MRGKTWLWTNMSLLAVLASVVIAAFLVEPHDGSVAGRGTFHGPPCLISRVVGLTHCPSCGLTRGFAWMARGDFPAAQRMNPWSMPLFATVWFCLVCAATSLLLRSAKVWYAALALVGLEGLAYLFYWVVGMFSILRPT